MKITPPSGSKIKSGAPWLLLALALSGFGTAPLLRADPPLLAPPSGNAVVPLWPDGAPGFEARKDIPEKWIDYGVARINNPTLAVFLPPPQESAGAAIIVLPGGGQQRLVIGQEGYTIGDWLVARGISAFVLKYRLFRDIGQKSPYTLDNAGQDAVRAIRYVHAHAAEWHVDPDKIGILGLSAGGEVVGQALLHPDDGNPNAADPVERASSRVRFQVLVYPGHLTALPEKGSPPAFLVAGNEDPGAPFLCRLFLAFHDAGVPAELHIYSGVGHAFNLHVDDPRPVGAWPDRLYDWLRASGFLDTPAWRRPQAG